VARGIIEEKSDWTEKKFPDFKLPDEESKERTLKEFGGKFLIIYFYPKDLTPGCTTEAISFNDNLLKLKKKNVEVIGVSPDEIQKHKTFKNKHKLKFSLISDVEKILIKELGLWIEKSMYGKKYMGVSRETFLVGPDSKVIKHYKKVKVANHVEELLGDLDEIT
jgi:thioredoxin-dependent peroxiredoxin